MCVWTSKETRRLNHLPVILNDLASSEDRFVGRSEEGVNDS